MTPERQSFTAALVPQSRYGLASLATTKKRFAVRSNEDDEVFVRAVFRARGIQVEDFAADVVPLLDALSIERTVRVGHSGSCLVAGRVALDHPDRVAGAVRP